MENDIENKKEEEEEEGDEEKPSCPICMQPYNKDDELRILPCSHEFHIQCIDQWLPVKKMCPLCRHDITKPLTTNNKQPLLQSSQNNISDNV